MNFSTDNNSPTSPEADTACENELDISNQETAELETSCSDDYSDSSDGNDGDSYINYDNSSEVPLTNVEPEPHQGTTEPAAEPVGGGSNAEESKSWQYMPKYKPKGIVVEASVNNRITYLTPAFNTLKNDKVSKLKQMVHIEHEIMMFFRLFNNISREFGAYLKRIHAVRRDLRALSRRSNYIKVQINMCRWVSGMSDARQQRLLSNFAFKLNDLQAVCKRNYSVCKANMKIARVCIHRIKKLTKRTMQLSSELHSLKNGITPVARLNATVMLSGIGGDYDRASLFIPRIEETMDRVYSSTASASSRINRISAHLDRSIESQHRAR